MIKRRVVVPADSDRLWQALTDPDEAGRWLGGELAWTAEEGEPLRFTPAPVGDSEPPREGQVEEVVRGRYLRFVWWPEDGGPESASEVAYELEPVIQDDPSSPPATILTVEEAPLVPAGRASCSAWSPLDNLQFHVWAARSLAGRLAA